MSTLLERFTYDGVGHRLTETPALTGVTTDLCILEPVAGDRRRCRQDKILAASPFLSLKRVKTASIAGCALDVDIHRTLKSPRPISPMRKITSILLRGGYWRARTTFAFFGESTAVEVPFPACMTKIPRCEGSTEKNRP